VRRAGGGATLNLRARFGPRSTEETPMLLRRALPALLAVWGAALLGLAVLDWAGYGVALQLLVLAR
jgi:hypothetical protein